ncbi:hypothetical protein ACIBSV_02945 [Embleya sp. NPDC050154]|uniref:hypothetical protein n=1 Tax=Embleya sp. NPDC050154 TaxID=3363988 RepID=UPI00378CBD2A
MISRERALYQAVDRLEHALGEQDEALLNNAFGQLRDAFENAQPKDSAEVGPRLAGALSRTPMGAEAILAVMIGACVENGADLAACSGPVLAGVRDALRNVAGFPVLWEEAVGGDLPERDHLALGEVLGRVAEATGGLDEAKFAAVSAWMQLPLWEMAAVAMLSREAIRRAVQADGTLVALAEEIALGDADLKCLRYLLKMFDDEPLVVLHRPTGTGYRLRVTRVGDNFQLHTLIAHVLIAGGHIPGDPPSAEAVAVCRDAAFEPAPHTTGVFNLSGVDGGWIWNEGCPADIPVVDGERVLVLDPPAYERSWRAGRFYPGITGDVTLEATLDRTESEAYLAKVAPPRTWPDGD